jgi:arabinan endo-1,5-alpha-L-arabinosidase
MKRSGNWMVTALLAMGTVLLTAAESSTAFKVQLEGVKFDYPGYEHWAEIQRPDGSHVWAFAIFEGKDGWSIPVEADVSGEYRLLRVERRRGTSREPDRLGTNSQVRLQVSNPMPSQSPPSLSVPVEAGEFKTFFAAEEPWCVNDHTFVQGPDKQWHLFGITHPKPLIFDKDPGHRLAHATATTLLQSPWEAKPPAVTRDWEKYREFLLWAPYVLRHEGLYYMFVCVGDKDTHRYRIHLLTSPDLQEWTRSADNPMVVDGFDGRDPFVMRVGDEWVLYYTANSTPDCGNHIIACLTSKDLVHWGGRRVAFMHPRAGSFGGPTESPFIVRRGTRYYLFVCDNEWTDVYVSEDPFHWDFGRKATRILAHAAEVTRDVDGRWYISHAGWTGGPVKLAPLYWHDGLDDAETNILPAEK